jgi:hypothetical protein
VPFRDDILGGLKLVRSAIQSANFVTGLTGWRIQRAGTAEFSNATIRGSISAASGTIVLDSNGILLQNADGSFVELETTFAGLGALILLNPQNFAGKVYTPGKLFGTLAPASPSPYVSLVSPIIDNGSASSINVYGETNTGTGDTAIILSANNITLNAKTKFSVPTGKLILGALSQSIPNAAITQVSYTTEIRDTYNFHDNVTNNSRVTPSVAGVYRVTASTLWAANATGARRTYIGKNGSVIGPVAVQQAGTANQLSQLVINQVECNGTTDYFSHHVFQDSTVALNVVGDSVESTTFQCALMWEYVSSN